MDYYISLFNDFRSGLSILEHGTEYLIEGWYCVRPLVRWPGEILYHLPPKKVKRDGVFGCRRDRAFAMKIIFIICPCYSIDNTLKFNSKDWNCR